MFPEQSEHLTFVCVRFLQENIPETHVSEGQVKAGPNTLPLSNPPAHLQEKLTDFLPKLLDCSTEVRSFQEPPKLPAYSTLQLCERYARVMASLSRTPADGR